MMLRRIFCLVLILILVIVGTACNPQKTDDTEVVDANLTEAEDLLYNKFIPDIEKIFEYNSIFYKANDEVIERGKTLVADFSDENKLAFFESIEHLENLFAETDEPVSSISEDDLFDLREAFGLLGIDYTYLWSNNTASISSLVEGWENSIEFIQYNQADLFEAELEMNIISMEVERAYLTYGLMDFIADLDDEYYSSLMECVEKYPDLWLEDVEWITDIDKIGEIMNEHFDNLVIRMDEVGAYIDALDE